MLIIEGACVPRKSQSADGWPFNVPCLREVVKKGVEFEKPSPCVSQKGAQEVSKDRFTGEFVDPNDRKAMERWARIMCQRLDLHEAADTLEVEPDISAVAKTLMDRSTDSASVREAAVLACEEELRKRYPDNS